MATGYRIDAELFLTPCGNSQLDEYEFGVTLVSAEIRSPEPIFSYFSHHIKPTRLAATMETPRLQPLIPPKPREL